MEGRDKASPGELARDNSFIEFNCDTLDSIVILCFKKKKKKKKKEKKERFPKKALELHVSHTPHTNEYTCAAYIHTHKRR